MVLSIHTRVPMKKKTNRTLPNLPKYEHILHDRVWLPNATQFDHVRRPSGCRWFSESVPLSLGPTLDSVRSPNERGPIFSHSTLPSWRIYMHYKAFNSCLLFISPLPHPHRALTTLANIPMPHANHARPQCVTAYFRPYPERPDL